MPRSDEYDDYDDPAARPDGTGVPFPPGVKAAGMIWIGFGVIGLLGAATLFVFMLVWAGGAGAGGVPVFCAPVCLTLFAIVFLMAGIETVKGKAKGILGNAVGSIFFGVLYLGQAALAVSRGAGAGMVEVVVGAALFGVLGLALVGAGVFALFGKSDYEKWRRAHGMDWGSRRSRRRTQEEQDFDDEDRPRRRPPRREYDDDDDPPRRERDLDDGR